MAASGNSTGPPESVDPLAATELIDGSNTDTGKEKQKSKMAVAAVGEGSGALPVAPVVNTPPLPPLPLRCPPYPKSGKRKALREWDRECRRICDLAAKDPRRRLPTVIEPTDPDTADSVACPRDKTMIRRVGRSIVSVSSVVLEGDDDVTCQCTGIVVAWNETNKCARILTSSDIVDGLDHKSKIHVRLPNNTVIEGQLLFFNKHYNIALLEISSESDLPLQLPSFGSNPNYGQEVFVLARDEESSLMARHGRILWADGLDYFGINYCMFLNCDLPPSGDGGAVIDHDGNIVGMAFFSLKPSILAISTIMTCIAMWSKFSRIARPAHGLRLRTMELLDMSLQEVISRDHNIDSGYIVDEVEDDSTAERLGVRYGDVIVSFDGLHSHTLPELEDYLLSLGWKFLEKNIDSSSTTDLTLEVYDLLGHVTRNITLPVEFSGH